MSDSSPPPADDTVPPPHPRHAIALVRHELAGLETSLANAASTHRLYAATKGKAGHLHSAAALENAQARAQNQAGTVAYAARILEWAVENYMRAEPENTGAEPENVGAAPKRQLCRCRCERIELAKARLSLEAERLWAISGFYTAGGAWFQVLECAELRWVAALCASKARSLPWKAECPGPHDDKTGGRVAVMMVATHTYSFESALQVLVDLAKVSGTLDRYIRHGYQREEMT